MSFFNDAQRDGLLTGRYICSECGGLMEFEDEWEDTLVCPACGHSVDLEHYGMENDEEYDALYCPYDGRAACSALHRKCHEADVLQGNV